MDVELNRLESQIEQLIGMNTTARTEVRNLRLRVAALEAENRQLTGKLKFAVEKFESLLEKLPEN
ncbi:MAG: hypothetical protein RBT55_02100 [Rhodocyclaceae bacterium]|jgi:FtsZ-binding cell division protein ZapB|nr:hypothetical protein [Rhodocyclaceae bacterium]